MSRSVKRIRGDRIERRVGGTTKRIGLAGMLVVIALTFLPAKAEAAPSGPLVSRASSTMSIYGSSNGLRVWAGAQRSRSVVFGDSEWVCLGAERATENSAASPAVRTVVREESCAERLSIDEVDYEVDPFAWEASISGTLPSTATKETWSWNTGQRTWQLDKSQPSASRVTFGLRWRAKGVWVDPWIDGPVCIFYGPPFVFPCLKPVAAGVERVARVDGSIGFGTLGRVTFPMNPAAHPWAPNLAIWWET